MAIKYYCGLDMLASIDLNQNQLVKPRIENLGSDPSGVEGQIYYNTTNDVLRLYTAAGWVTLASAGGVTSFTNAFGTFVSGTANSSATGAVNMGTIDLSASGSPSASTFLRGDNQWASVPQGDITGIDAGAGIVVNDGATATPEVAVRYDGNAANLIQSAASLEGTSIATTDVIIYSDSTDSDKVVRGLVSDLPFTNNSGDITAVTVSSPITGGGTSGSVNIGHATQSDTGTTDTATLSFGGTFDAYTDVTTNATGHVTGHEVTTFTLPANPNTNETYTLPVAAGGLNSAVLNLTAGGSGSGIKSSVTINGTTNEIAITESAGNNGSVTIGLPDDVTIAGELTVSGTGQSSFAGQVTVPATPSANTDAASKQYVLAQVGGVGGFQGGYNASTNPGSPALSGGSNVALDQGDFYVVTTDGTFFTETVEVGDFIFANADIPASSSPSLSDYTVVIQDQNIAGAGSTDGATEKGVAGFNSAHFGVTANGWVSSNIYGGTTSVGIVPTGGSASTFLRGDGNWVTPTNTEYSMMTSSTLGLGKLEDDTEQTVAANAVSATSGRTYGIQKNSSNQLVVNVPWTDSVGAVTSVDESPDNNQKGIKVNPLTGAVKVGLDIIGQTNLTSLANSDDFIVYDQSTTTNKRVGFDTLKSAIAGTATITLSGDVTGSGTTSITTTIASSAVEASMLNNNVISGQTELAAAPATSDELLISDSGSIKRISVANLASAVQGNNGYTETLTSPSAGSETVTHSLGSFDVIVQLYGDTSKETIYACVDRTSINALSITFDSAVGEDVRVLVSKVS